MVRADDLVRLAGIKCGLRVLIVIGVAAVWVNVVPFLEVIVTLFELGIGAEGVGGWEVMRVELLPLAAEVLDLLLIPRFAGDEVRAKDLIIGGFDGGVCAGVGVKACVRVGAICDDDKLRLGLRLIGFEILVGNDEAVVCVDVCRLLLIDLLMLWRAASVEAVSCVTLRLVALRR